jgi:hypothetical protein
MKSTQLINGAGVKMSSKDVQSYPQKLTYSLTNNVCTDLTGDILQTGGLNGMLKGCFTVPNKQFKETKTTNGGTSDF